MAESHWVVINDAPLLEQAFRRQAVEIRGHGRDQHGVVGAGGVRGGGRNLVALPSVDDLD